MGRGTRGDIKQNEALGSLATLQDLTGLCQPSASLCLSHNRETQTEQPVIGGVAAIRRSKPFANANSIVASCQAAAQKEDVDFHMNQNRPIVRKVAMNAPSLNIKSRRRLACGDDEVKSCFKWSYR